MNRYAILKNKSAPPTEPKPTEHFNCSWEDIDVSTKSGLSELLIGVYKGFVSAEDAAKIIRKEQRRVADASESRLSRAMAMERESSRGCQY